MDFIEIWNTKDDAFLEQIINSTCFEYPPYENSDQVYVFPRFGVVWVVQGNNVYGSCIEPW